MLKSEKVIRGPSKEEILASYDSPRNMLQQVCVVFDTDIRAKVRVKVTSLEQHGETNTFWLVRGVNPDTGNRMLVRWDFENPKKRELLEEDFTNNTLTQPGIPPERDQRLKRLPRT